MKNDKIYNECCQQKKSDGENDHAGPNHAMQEQWEGVTSAPLQSVEHKVCGLCVSLLVSPLSYIVFVREGRLSDVLPRPAAGHDHRSPFQVLAGVGGGPRE